MDDTVCICSWLASITETPDPRRCSKSSCNFIHPKRPAVVGSTLRDAQPAGVETKTKPRPRKRKGKSHKQLSQKGNPVSSKSCPKSSTRRCNLFPVACSTGSHGGNALFRTSPRAADAASSTRHGIHPGDTPATRRRRVKQERLRPLFFGLLYDARHCALLLHPSRHSVRAFLGQINPGTRSPPSADLDQQRGPASALLEQHPRLVPQEEL
jgi:hypothetical protein